MSGYKYNKLEGIPERAPQNLKLNNCETERDMLVKHVVRRTNKSGIYFTSIRKLVDILDNRWNHMRMRV